MSGPCDAMRWDEIRWRWRWWLARGAYVVCAYAVGGAAVFSLGKGWDGTWDERREDFEARVSLGLTGDRTRRGILCARRGFGV